MLSEKEELLNEVVTLRKELGDEKKENSELQNKVSEKEQLLNQIETLEKELDNERREKADLQDQMSSETINDITSANLRVIDELNATINRLEEAISDKNKTIRLQQQKLNDMKKTFQKDMLQSQQIALREQQTELNQVDESPKVLNISSTINESSAKFSEIPSNDVSPAVKDINFTYLKNVLFKFMTSSEYEAIHLIKAISVLLNFSKEEEMRVKEAMEWKMSWFAPLVGTKPKSLKK